MITEIFLDLDGVCADFEKRYNELYNAEPEVNYSLSKNKISKLHRERFKSFVDSNHFATLDIIHGTQEAMSFFVEVNEKHKIPVCFLTSSAREEYLTTIENQKKQWLKSHNIIFNLMIVPGKRYKCLYAKPGRLLCDDTKQNIDDWIHHGGIGIHHTTWETSIHIINSLIERNK